MLAKAAAISTGPATHLDHLGVLASLLKIPLIVTEEEVYQLAKTFYPMAQLERKEPYELSLDYLASSFDVLFGCGKFWAAELLPLFSLFSQKKMRFVFCPHGNSDKGHSLSSSPLQDLSLVYGEHMLSLLKKTAKDAYITTGNYRYEFYRTHKAFYDRLASEHLYFEKGKKTILYAPTWQSNENPTSFFEMCAPLIEQLPSSFNLILKLHPFLEEDYPSQTYRLISCYEHHPRIVFLKDFPPVYPLLSYADLYLGDFSSVGYDFLAFDKPMFFFNPLQKDQKKDQGLFLHRCGMQVPSLKNAKALYQFVEDNLEKNQTLFSSIRKEIYAYAFGNEKAPEQLYREICNALKK